MTDPNRMKYRFGMPWYGWLLLFLVLVFAPTIKKQLFPPAPIVEPKKQNLEKKQ